MKKKARSETVNITQAKGEYEDIPFGFSNNISDFINGLIQRKPKNILGKNNINEVINHS